MRASAFLGLGPSHICRTPEELPDDLQCHVIGGGFFPVFSHRYLVAPFPIVTPVPLAEALAAVEQDVCRYLDKGDPFAAMRYVQKPYMSDALYDWEVAGYISESRRAGHGVFWKLLNYCWTRTELPHQDIATYRALFASDRPYPRLVMHRDERQALAAMPDRFMIWRGVGSPNRHDALEAVATGLSWTTDKKKAEWFARRWVGDDKKAYVACAEVEKDVVVAYFCDRGEKEIVVTDQIDFELTPIE